MEIGRCPTFLPLERVDLLTQDLTGLTASISTGLALRCATTSFQTHPGERMLVPAMIYGFYPEVQRRIRRMIKTMQQGTSFEDALCGQGLIDTDEHPGLILLQEANRFLGDQEHFHVVYPLAMLLEPLLAGKLTAEDEDIVFASCLQSAWGVLLLLPHTLATWIKPPHRWIPFLRAAARFWSILEVQGARYSYGLPYGTPLSDEGTTVDYLLINSGIAPHHNRWEPYRRPPNWPALVEAYAAQKQSIRN